MGVCEGVKAGGGAGMTCSYLQTEQSQYNYSIETVAPKCINSCKDLDKLMAGKSVSGKVF